ESHNQSQFSGHLGERFAGAHRGTSGRPQESLKAGSPTTWGFPPVHRQYRESRYSLAAARLKAGCGGSYKPEVTSPWRKSPPAPVSRTRASSASTSSAWSVSRRGNSDVRKNP